MNSAKKLIDWIKKDQVGSRHPPLALVMLARLALLALLLVVLLGFSDYTLDFLEISLFMGLTFAISLLYTLWMRQDGDYSRQAMCQFAVDAFIITGLVHFTGGAASALSLLYPLLILSAGIIVSGRVAVKTALLSSFLYIILIALEYNDFLPYRGEEPSPYENLASLSQMTMLQVLLFVFFAAVSSYVSDRYLYQSLQLRRLREMTKSTLESVSVPLLAIKNPEGLIKLANPAACRLLKRSESELADSQFSALFAERAPTPREIISEQDCVWCLKKADGTSFPVSLEISKDSLSGAVLSAIHQDSEDAEVNLVAFQDMSRLMQEEEGIRTTEKTKTAVGMITEMAHVVRNPLTAIRGAGELINAAVEEALSRQHQITEEEFHTLKSMCEIIFDQTRELNSKVEDFMSYADGDQEKLLDLVAQANLWGERVTKKRQTAPKK